MIQDLNKKDAHGCESLFVIFQGGKEKPLGNDLLSQEVALQVPSALTGLTTGFGMGPGVPLPLKSPRDVFTTLD